jgi:hypothetical protein
MTEYRITEFTSSDMDKALEASESIRSIIEKAGADFIDIINCGDGNGMVVAKYRDQATMETSSSVAKQAFGKLIEAGVVDGASINARTGSVMISF